MNWRIKALRRGIILGAFYYFIAHNLSAAQVWRPTGVTQIPHSEYTMWGGHGMTAAPYTLWRKNGAFMVHLGGNMWRRAHPSIPQTAGIEADNKIWAAFQTLKGKLIVNRYHSGRFAIRSYVP